MEMNIVRKFHGQGSRLVRTDTSHEKAMLALYTLLRNRLELINTLALSKHHFRHPGTSFTLPVEAHLIAHNDCPEAWGSLSH